MTREPTLRCAACGGTVRVGQPWCTQCFQALEATAPAPAPPVAVPAVPLLPAQRGDPPALLPVLHATAPPSWPCAGCGTRNPLELSACTSCGGGFLPAEPLRLVLPGVGDLAVLPRGRRLGLAVLVALVVLLLTAALAAG